MPARRSEDDLPDLPQAQDIAPREAPEIAPREAPEEALCGPQDVAFEVRWAQDGTGLRGQLVARNVGDRACRLASKPTVTPLAQDGTPLPVPTTITLEFMAPGYALLQPGDVATARISWNSWCGQPVSDRALVDWNSGSAVVPVLGPVQPGCDRSLRPQMTSYWFFLESPGSEA